MDKNLVRRIVDHFARGDKVLFGFDHFGAVRVKVKHGPFKLLTTHLRTDQETFNAIQAWLSDDDEDEQTSEMACQRDPHIPPLRNEPDFAETPPDLKTAEPVWKEPRAAALGASAPGNVVANDHAPEALASKPAALCLDMRGKLPHRDVFGAVQRKARSQTDRCQNTQQRSELQLDAQEIASHRFELSDIDGVWHSMIAGKIPKVASEVWNRMHPGKSVHVIADEMQIPVRECLFWLCVFRRHLDVCTDRGGGTYAFQRGKDEPTLSAAVQMKRQAAR